jgi:adenylate cyclase
VALVLAALAAAAFSYATEGRQRRFVRRVFAQYMDESIVTHLLDNPELIKPGGRRQRVTVFFADIAGFTSLAERLSPEETSRMLHTVLNCFSEVIIRHHGVIDKYIGDCIMAFWGAPLAGGEDEFNACSAAVSCLEELARINEEFRAEGLYEISIRIGIHSGDAIVGNLGSDRLFDFTVIGDTVNLASRLESANKFFHTRSMVSEDCLGQTNDAFLARELGLIAVKGKSDPVRIYELLAKKELATGEQLAFVAGFQAAIDLFYRQEWDEGARAFAGLLEMAPGDETANYYRKWCDILRNNAPLTDDWNVIKMTEK